MTRRVLICTIGATPQVVTETVWALQQEDPPWSPDEIEIVTTTHEFARIRNRLQSPDGPLAVVLGRVPQVKVFIPAADGSAGVFDNDAPLREPSYEALADVSTREQATLMGDLILRRIASAAADDDSEIHVSLAGGRKTMSAHALLALSLVGRPRDRASHVLVNGEFEGHRDFWHPDQGGKLARRGESDLTLDPKTASIVLIPVPQILMRYRVKNAARLASLTLEKATREANLAEALRLEPELLLHTSLNEVELCGHRVKLTPKLFGLFRLVAEARRARWPFTNLNGDLGWLTMAEVRTAKLPDGEGVFARARRYLAEAVSAAGGDPDGKNKILKAWDDVPRPPTEEARQERLNNQLRPTLNLLRAELEDGFGEPAALQLMPVGSKQEGGAPFGLNIPSLSITIR